LNKSVFYLHTHILENLTHLFLGTNELKEINLQDLRQLKYLNLSNNKINQIGPGNIRGLNNLIELDLSHNEIKVFNQEYKQSTGHFCSTLDYFNLETLTKLDLSHNQLKEIRRNEFVDFKSLNHLYLNNNQIEQIDYEAFGRSNQPKNNNVKLANNNECFRVKSKLVELNLSNNLIHRIDKETYRRLTLLTKLDLSFKLKLRLFFNNFFYSIKTFNRIKEIVKKEFHYLYSLNHICLNDNQIMQIDPDAFRGLIFLNTIHLHNNHLLISLYLEESVDYVSIRNQINDKDDYILNLVKIII